MPLPLLGLIDGIETRYRPEFDEDVPEMAFDGRLGQVQARRDLAVAERLRDQAEHFEFTCGQRSRRRCLLDVGEALTGYAEYYPVAVGADSADRHHELLPAATLEQVSADADGQQPLNE